MIQTLRQGGQPAEFREQPLPDNASLFFIGPE